MNSKTDKLLNDFCRSYVSEFKAVEKLIAIVEDAIQSEREACTQVCMESARQWKDFPGGKQREIKALALTAHIANRKD